MAEKMAVVRNAVATHRFEGIAVPEHTIADMVAVARGELTTEQAIERARDRIGRSMRTEPRSG